MMKRRILMGAALFATLLTVSGTAMAAVTGYVPTALRLRAGPGTEYPIIARLPGNTNVFVNGCVEGWNWCDVEWNGLHGWTSGRLLQLMDRNRPVAVYRYAPTVGVPVVVFTQRDYWGRYYHDRPFYRTWHRDNDRYDDRYDNRHDNRGRDNDHGDWDRHH